MEGAPPSAAGRHWFRRCWPILKWCLFALVLVFVGRRGWELWRTTPRGTVHVDWVWLIPGVACYALGWLPSVWFWRELLGGLGPKPAWYPSLRAYFIGQLGKYVPGKALVLVLRATLLEGTGCRASVAAITATYETLTMMGAGAAIAVALAPSTMGPSLWETLPEWLQAWRRQTLLLPLAVAAATLASLPVIARLFTLIARKTTSQAVDGAEVAAGISPRMLVEGLAVLTVGWALFALSLGCVLQAVAAESGDAPGFSVWLAAVTLSTVGGFVILIAPGGIGVREMLLCAVLQSQPGVTPAQAFIAAWLLRAVWLVGEVLSVAAVARPAARQTAPVAGTEPLAPLNPPSSAPPSAARR